MRAGWFAVASPGGDCTRRRPPSRGLARGLAARQLLALGSAISIGGPQLQRAAELRLGGQRIAHAGGDAPAQQVAPRPAARARCRARASSRSRTPAASVSWPSREQRLRELQRLARPRGGDRPLPLARLGGGDGGVELGDELLGVGAHRDDGASRTTAS